MIKSGLLSKKNMFYIILAVYVAVNLATLTSFPFVHSDEAWLSGLSRNILEKGDYSVTETFFDLMERHPHAIKIIFHTIQILFIKIMGYSLFTFRFISLCFGLLTLYFVYRLGIIIFSSARSALLTVILMAVDVQFIYAAHFARQEIIILFLLVLGMWYKLKNSENLSIRHDIMLGIIIGLAVGIHPNSFIISLPFGLIYLYEILILKQRRFLGLTAYIATVAGFAAFFVAVSFSFDPNFISNYAKYGNSFDVFDPITSKAGEAKEFYLKLYYGVSGTYYTPDIRFQFFLFGAALPASIYRLFRHRQASSLKHGIISVLLAIAAINAGIIIIGRFNQTSIVLLFPLFYILLVYSLDGMATSYRYTAALLILAALTAFTLSNQLEYRGNSYDGYLKEISHVINPADNTLGNLNSDYFFANGKLHDYRNLQFLEDSGMSFEAYIKTNDIKWIIFSEELELIHQLRPRWDGIYGPLDYYDEMKEFLENDCTLQYEFTDAYYGIRIVRYIGLKDWRIKIYRVNNYTKSV